MNDKKPTEVPEEFKTSTFPELSEALVQRLNECFPERTPELAWETKEVWYASGQRSVIRFINQVFAEQSETVL